MTLKKMTVLLLSALLCLAFAGCRQEAPSTTVPTETKSHNSILPGYSQTTATSQYSPVYVTVFEEVAILATYPVLEYEGEEPLCDPREVSQGGSIRCGGDHEDEFPIRRVIIADQLTPRAMNDWFRNLVYLESIEGLEKIQTQYVTDMSHLFAGCERLTGITAEGWDVSNVTDMTGIFDGCAALASLPAWYTGD